MEPYKFTKIIFNDGLLNKSIDATYIIHLENNGRYEHIMEQLSEYHPSNIVYILFNKGYKKSKKKSFINKSPLDLVDAFLEIFKHANEQNYNNILILEDDFIFSKKIKQINHINNINMTIKKLGNDDFIYILGCIPIIKIPYDCNNYNALTFGGTHSIIYSKQHRINILNINQADIHDWDMIHAIRFGNMINFKQIMYYKPLCYQLFTDTENSKNWNLYIKDICMFYAKLLNVHKQVEPGFSNSYLISKILSIVLFMFIISRIIKKL